VQDYSEQEETNKGPLLCVQQVTKNGRPVYVHLKTCVQSVGGKEEK
jgi:hypothetical protein